MVFGLFSKDRALKRAIEKATNKLAQSVDRWAAMEKLRDNGTDEALYALCKRFSFTYDKGVEDEQEKQWVVDVLSAKGIGCLGPLRRYMKNNATIAYPLQILGKVGSKEQILEVIDEVLATEEPGYTRDPNKRIGIINWLSDWDAATDDDIACRAIPYLEDFDENVRFKVVEAIALHPHESAAAPLVNALIREEEESKRLKIRIAEVLAEHEMDLGDHKDEVAAMFDDALSGFHLKHDKLKKK